MYSENSYSTYRNIMIASVNCLILGEEVSNNSFNVAVGKVYTSDDGVDIAFDQFTVSNFKELLFRRQKVKKAVQDPDSMNLYKVELSLSSLKDKIYTIDEIKNLGAMMESMFEFKDYFNNEDKIPKSKCLHIFIVPTTARNLPETLEYRDPHPLLMSSGSLWDFQASEALKNELKNAIRDHFKYWKAGQCEKTKIPQYFILAGAGEGKSRTAQELPKLLIECTDDDVDLQNRLKSALVFNLSFENGTKLFRKKEDISAYAIGNRMLFQLLPGDSWNEFYNRYDIAPEDVLRRVANHLNRELNDLNVIVILDGIQVAMNSPGDGKDKESFFYNCISSLGILSLYGPFIVTCCTATISMPIHNFLASSQQRRVFLPITSLQPPRINNNPVFVNNPVMKMLINDMGGHGRALEALGDSVGGKDLNNVNFVDLINDVRTELVKNYQGWLSKTTYLKPILRIILSRTQVDKNQNIVTSDGNKITVDDVTQFGLVRFMNQSTDQVVGYLTCPYMWLWIMAHASPNDKLLQNWNFNYYNEVRNKSGEPTIPPGCQYWQNFEYFVAQFRSLKSNIYNDGEKVELGIIHNGAEHNFGDSSIYNRNLKLTTSVRKVSTKSEFYIYRNKFEILCQKEMVDIRKAEHIIINAPSAESGDSFCPIKMVGNELLKTETHQCKLVKQAISQGKFKDEYEKATSPGDTFILYTSASSKNLELLHQPMSAIVSKDNWKDYFGSFAGRCYNYAMGPPDIHEATYTQLTGINFIAEARATTIMEERSKRKFSGIDDCENRTKIPRTYLEPFFKVVE